MAPPRARRMEMSLPDKVRCLVVEMNKPEFRASDLFQFAYENKRKLPGLEFRYGADFPYSERLEDILSLLLLSGDLESSPADSCKLVVSDRLRKRLGLREEVAGAVAG
jgi:hypothetical protein